MTKVQVAGIDWAGGGWVAVILEDDEALTCRLYSSFESIPSDDFDEILVDVPIGLPCEDTLTQREELDAAAREYTERPSSVFPVPSRAAVEMMTDNYPVDDDSPYDTVKELYRNVSQKNEDEIGKGLSWQSFYIIPGIAAVDEFLPHNDDENPDTPISESHPEVCFRGMKGEPLAHPKTSAAGFGERLEALGKFTADQDDLDVEVRDSVAEMTQNLPENADSSDAGSVDDITIDDVLDALALALVAASEKLSGWPGSGGPGEPLEDETGLPMQMVHWRRQTEQ